MQLPDGGGGGWSYGDGRGGGYIYGDGLFYGDLGSGCGNGDGNGDGNGGGYGGGYGHAPPRAHYPYEAIFHATT